MSNRILWVNTLRTIRQWSKLLGTSYPDQLGLQLGLLDYYVELLLLSKEMNRKVPSWVMSKI